MIGEYLLITEGLIFVSANCCGAKPLPGSIETVEPSGAPRIICSIDPTALIDLLASGENGRPWQWVRTRPAQQTHTEPQIPANRAMVVTEVDFALYGTDEPVLYIQLVDPTSEVGWPVAWAAADTSFVVGEGVHLHFGAWRSDRGVYVPPRWTLDLGAAGRTDGSAAVRGTLLDPLNVAEEAVPAQLMASVHAVTAGGANGGITRPQPAVARLKSLIQTAPDFHPPRK